MSLSQAPILAPIPALGRYLLFSLAEPAPVTPLRAGRLDLRRIGL